MAPLDPEAGEHVLTWNDGIRRLVAIRHAFIHQRPGLWGDDARRPKSVVLVREGDGRLEAFGAGEPHPAVNWLASRGRPISLLAPLTWEAEIREYDDSLEYGTVETWFRKQSSRALRIIPEEAVETPPSIPVERLSEDDAPVFIKVAPRWALRSWDCFEEMIEQGAAFAVVAKDGNLASIAWILEQDNVHDEIGVSTLPRYRRLGLARAAAGALVEHVVQERRKYPLWTAASENLASIELARRLDFSIRVKETLIRWDPKRRS